MLPGRSKATNIKRSVLDIFVSVQHSFACVQTAFLAWLDNLPDGQGTLDPEEDVSTDGKASIWHEQESQTWPSGVPD